MLHNAAVQCQQERLMISADTCACCCHCCCNSRSLGQNLAKVELQVVLAMLLSRFKFSPGPDLQREAAVAAATGKPPITAVYALAEVHVTLQPAGGKMLLLAEPR